MRRITRYAAIGLNVLFLVEFARNMAYPPDYMPRVTFMFLVVAAPVSALVFLIRYGK